MNFKKFLAAGLAMVMSLSLFAACSEDVPVNTEGVLNTGHYEGYGIKFDYDPVHWVNLYNNEYENATGHVVLYDATNANVAEAFRAENHFTTYDEAVYFVEEQIEQFSTLAEVVSKEVKENEEKTHVVGVLKLKSLENVADENGATVKKQLYAQYEFHAYVEGEKTAAIMMLAQGESEEFDTSSFDKISDSFVFSEVMTPGEVHDESEKHYNYSPALTDIDGYNRIKIGQVDFEAAEKDGTTVTKTYSAPVVGNPDDAKSVYTFYETLQSNAYGIYVMTQPIYNEVVTDAEGNTARYYASASDVIVREVGPWLDSINTEGSNYIPSAINGDYKQLVDSDGRVVWYMAYCHVEPVYQTNENGEMIYSSAGAPIFVGSKLVNTYLDIFDVKYEDDYIYLTNIEVVGNELTEEGKEALMELASMYNIEADVMAPFSEFAVNEDGLVVSTLVK